MRNNVVEIEGLSFTYSTGRTPALEGINFNAELGEYVLITGPSGCGKSTLCRVLNGLIPNFYSGKLEGDAIVAGFDVHKTPTYVLARHVGMVFQDPENQLFLSTVEREIAFGLENMGLSRLEIRRRVSEVLKIFGLEDLRDKAPYELSGGQQQKVAIASVIAMQPEILVLDEPTANLDPLSAKEILGLVSGLVKDYDILALVVEHRLELVLRYATRVVIMDGGRILVDDDPRKAMASEHAKIVGIPRVVELYRKLKSRGIDLGKMPITPEEFTELLASGVGKNE